MSGRKILYGLQGQTTVSDVDITDRELLEVSRAGVMYDIIHTGTPTSRQVLHEMGIGKLTFLVPFEADVRDPGGVSDVATFQKIDIVYKN